MMVVQQWEQTSGQIMQLESEKAGIKFRPPNNRVYRKNAEASTVCILQRTEWVTLRKAPDPCKMFFGIIEPTLRKQCWKQILQILMFGR